MAAQTQPPALMDPPQPPRPLRPLSATMVRKIYSEKKTCLKNMLTLYLLGQAAAPACRTVTDNVCTSRKVPECRTVQDNVSSSLWKSSLIISRN